MTPQPVVIAKLPPKIYLSPYIEPLNMRRAKEMTDNLVKQRATTRKIRETKKYYNDILATFS
jgi:hypothetical protein